jgi:hypothetical protein
MAFSYNGSSSFTSLGEIPLFSNINPISVSLWFYNNGTANEGKIIVAGRNPGVGSTRFNVIVNTSNRLRWESNNVNGGFYTILSDALPLSTWHHFAATTRSGEVKVYVNSNLIGTSTQIPSSVNNSRVDIGKNGSANEFYFNGRIAEVGFWSGILTSGDIVSLYKGASCDQVATPILYDRYPFVRGLYGIAGGTGQSSNVTVVDNPRIY